VDGDSIVVDSVPPLRQEPWVAIKGPVHKPGLYPWRAGMALRDLMRLAGGPRVGADLRHAQLARLPADRSQGQIAITQRVPLDSSYITGRDSAGHYRGAAGVAFPPAGSAPEIPLDPYDDVLILRQPDFELQQNVFVGGEVQYPGSYALTSKSERLTQLLRRAGGLTAQAYPEGIRFYRGGDSGRVNVDLPRALRDKESRDNLLLQPGDSIFIPEYQPSVRVFGAVNSAGNVLYRRGAGLDYYLSAAGGFARNADEGRVSVRFANGEVRTRSKWLFFSKSPAPGPGAEVFVPFKDPTDKTDYVALFGSIAQILASTVAIIVVVTR
jgi:protein involved in polysaccharide export with SLBB domain